jgi:hypothetical protein
MWAIMQKLRIMPGSVLAGSRRLVARGDKIDLDDWKMTDFGLSIVA